MGGLGGGGMWGGNDINIVLIMYGILKNNNEMNAKEYSRGWGL